MKKRGGTGTIKTKMRNHEGYCYSLYVKIFSLYFWNKILLPQIIREASKIKMSQRVEKVHNFLDPPPSPRMFWTFLNLGKIQNSMPPPPTVGQNHGAQYLN